MLIFLSELPHCLAVFMKASDAQIYSKSENYLPSILPPFPSLCPSASTCYTISPHNVPGMELPSVMMMEVTLNMSAVSVTDSRAALSTYKGQND